MPNREKSTQEAEAMRGQAAPTLTSYPTYKPSGVAWLGDVPEHWEVRRLKNLANLIMGQSPPSEDCSTERIGLPFLQGCAEFGSTYPQPVQFCRSPAKISPIGSILISVRAPVGKLNLADQRYGIGRGLAAVVPNPLLYDCMFCLYSLGFSTYSLMLESTGSTYDAVSVGDVGCVRMPLPTLSEQQAIARFLDHASQRIQRCICAKEKLIQLLEEEKQVIIHQAVTGQVDVRTGQPYPAYKDSRVEWLGKVPEHWEVRRLKTLCHMQSGDAITAMSIDTAGKYPVFGGNGIRGYASQYTHDGTFILIGRQGALCGNVHIARGRFWASEHAVVTTLHRNYVIEWFGAALETMDLNQYSIAAAQPGLSVDRVLNLWVQVPPAQEQTAIAQFLGKRTEKIQKGFASLQREIALLQEYRTRLIADVVTGKLDVRAAAVLETQPLAEEGEADGRLDAKEPLKNSL